MNRSTVIALAIGTCIAVTGLADPAIGAAHVKPKPGAYSGSATYPAGPQAVTFTVNKKHTKVVNFSSNADVAATCKAPNPSFQTPITPEKISKSGHFTQSFDAYTDGEGNPYRVTVTVKGHFTSSKKVAGTFTLVSKKYKHCNTTAKWTATLGAT